MWHKLSSSFLYSHCRPCFSQQFFQRNPEPKRGCQSKGRKGEGWRWSERESCGRQGERQGQEAVGTEPMAKLEGSIRRVCPNRTVRSKQRICLLCLRIFQRQIDTTKYKQSTAKKRVSIRHCEDPCRDVTLTKFELVLL